VPEHATPDSVALFERATRHADAIMARVAAGQLVDPTPCSEWTVQDLIDHMVGGPDYLVSAVAGSPPMPRAGASVNEYRAGVKQALTGLHAPGALDRTCPSPLGFKWTVGQAVAGTFMDQLIHTWDLATATGQDATLDPDLVDACTTMLATFLAGMPEIGRTNGLVGPAVTVPTDAAPQHKLLAMMGRQP
jgi:uncharacterized protein (TIGR03086 family)